MLHLNKKDMAPYTGNIDLSKRQKVNNPDGSYSTIRSINIETDGKHVLIPTVVNGKVVSNDEAIAHWRKTGEHLGDTFKSDKEASDYGQKLHESLAAGIDLYDGVAKKVSDAVKNSVRRK